MAFFKEKTINGYQYYYLTRSVRMPDGQVKTIQKLVKDTKLSPAQLEKKHSDYFIGKEKEFFSAYALSTYATDAIYSKSQFEKIESFKVDYAYTLRNFSKEQLKDVFDRFTANYTYESNALEGNSLTLKDVALVFDGRSIEGKDLREVYEARNSRKVMDHILKGKYKVREKDIIKMHRMLMRDIDVRTGYKTLPNYILGSSVKLTAPEKVAEEITALLDWYDDAVKHFHPLKVSALFHGRFEHIHPFEDGNGRVGRFLSNMILMENGYPPLIIRKTQRESYIKCMEDFHRGYTANLERLFLEKYKKTYKDFFAVYLKYVK
jgi:Fic family protein